MKRDLEDLIQQILALKIEENEESYFYLTPSLQSELFNFCNKQLKPKLAQLKNAIDELLMELRQNKTNLVENNQTSFIALAQHLLNLAIYIYQCNHTNIGAHNILYHGNVQSNKENEYILSNKKYVVLPDGLHYALQVPTTLLSRIAHYFQLPPNEINSNELSAIEMLQQFIDGHNALLLDKERYIRYFRSPVAFITNVHICNDLQAVNETPRISAQTRIRVDTKETVTPNSVCVTAEIEKRDNNIVSKWKRHISASTRKPIRWNHWEKHEASSTNGEREKFAGLEHASVVAAQSSHI